MRRYVVQLIQGTLVYQTGVDARNAADAVHKVLVREHKTIEDYEQARAWEAKADG